MHERLRVEGSAARSSIAGMATVTPHLQQETRRAWADYSERVRGLEGSEYDRVEQEAWEELQATLSAIATESPLADPPVG